VKIDPKAIEQQLKNLTIPGLDAPGGGGGGLPGLAPPGGGGGGLPGLTPPPGPPPGLEPPKPQ